MKATRRSDGSDEPASLDPGLASTRLALPETKAGPPPKGHERDSVEGLPVPGDLVAGKYRVEGTLGLGGMGIVLAAQHEFLEQRVAIKLLLPQTAEVPDASARFLQEARAASAIRSEHVVRVLDVGVLDSGLPYLVMEYLTGKNLEEVLLDRGPLPADEAVDYVLQTCQAITEAHALGTIHRDLKPSNLFLTTGADGTPLIKVLDFGISKTIHPDAPETTDPKLTSTTTMLGSPIYMSPEQVRSAKHVDGRTDIWSLGVILYQLLTARFPFEGSSMSAIFASIAADDPTPLSAHRPDLPAELQAIVLHCLQKDLKQRIPSVVDLARRLESFGTEQAQRSVRRIVELTSVREQPSPRGGRAVPLAVAAGGLLLTAAAAAMLRPAPPPIQHAAAWMSAALRSSTPPPFVAEPSPSSAELAPAEAPAEATTVARTASAPSRPPPTTAPPTRAPSASPSGTRSKLRENR